MRRRENAVFTRYAKKYKDMPSRRTSTGWRKRQSCRCGRSSRNWVALRTGDNAAYGLLRSGRLKGYRNGRTWRIPKESVRRFVLECVRLGGKLTMFLPGREKHAKR